MSKTAEEMASAIEFIKKTDLEKGSLWTETDDEIAEVLVDFHNYQSSSKDARIKELEEQVKFYEAEIPVNIEIRNRIKELEARLETAEKFIGEIGSNIHLPKWVKKKAKAFLTNKTE